MARGCSEERLHARTGSVPARALAAGLGSRTNQARNQAALLAGDVLRKFDRIDLSPREPLIEELDDLLQLLRHHVSDEYHSNSSTGEMLSDPAPELIGVCVAAQQVDEGLVWVPPDLSACSLVGSPQALNPPIPDSVGRVVQHLAYNLPPNARVG